MNELNKVESLEITDGDEDGYFRVLPTGERANEFNIAVLRLLDRERAPRGYNLTLRATDAGTPPRSSTATVHVTVADWNDHAPIFDKEHYQVQPRTDYQEYHSEFIYSLVINRFGLIINFHHTLLYYKCILL